jgi:hypothetical protein
MVMLALFGNGKPSRCDMGGLGKLQLCSSILKITSDGGADQRHGADDQTRGVCDDDPIEPFQPSVSHRRQNGSRFQADPIPAPAIPV